MCDNLTPQQPAQGILSRHSDQNWDAFLVECECASPEHAVEAHIGINRDDDFVTVEFLTNISTPWRLGVRKKYDGWGFSARLKWVWKILIYGRLELNADLILKDQAALNFADALRRAVEKHSVKSHE